MLEADGIAAAANGGTVSRARAGGPTAAAGTGDADELHPYRCTDPDLVAAAFTWAADRAPISLVTWKVPRSLSADHAM